MNKFDIKNAIVVAITFLNLSVVAHGALLSIDDPVFGPETITRDTFTKNDWLDITISTNYSYNDLVNQTLPGGDFEGFRLATFDEVKTLWQNAGIDIGIWNNEWRAELYTPIANIQSLIGITEDDLFYNWDESIVRTWGYIQAVGNYDISSLELFVRPVSSVGLFSVDYNPDPEIAYDNIGGYLVRPVPLPGAFWLLGGGFVGLLTVYRKRRRSENIKTGS